MATHKQVVLVILDGWGYREEKKHNAILQARTPFFDSLWREYPHTLLTASGEAVGLPPGQMGTSEIGHPALGTGTIIDQDLVRISKAARNNEFLDNPAFRELFDHVKKNRSTLHVVGLTSPGGVHSHQEHLHAFLKAAKDSDVEKVVIHAFTDGRDLPPQQAHAHLEELERYLETLGIGVIATAVGRYYGMDRDSNWDRIAKAEEAIFERQGSAHKGKKPSAVLRELYEKENAQDEFLEPLVFVDETGRDYAVRDNDGIMFVNFRSERTRQLSKRITERTKNKNIFFVTMTDYDRGSGIIDARVAFPPLTVETTLAAHVSKAGLTQAHIAETDKYAHVTYFFNGGSHEVHAGEEHVLVESRKDVKTHDLAPEMRAKEVADKVIEYIGKGTNFIVVNIANADILGHTAIVPAIVKGLEFVDAQLKRIVEAAGKAGTPVFVTADHGNAEINVHEKTGEPHTAHTASPVPGILTLKGVKLRDGGSLADVAPTILELFGLPVPSSMTGKSLIA
jgi:2,3-bisphosphoglycerate-independent phosphoglycerate mutase